MTVPRENSIIKSGDVKMLPYMVYTNAGFVKLKEQHRDLFNKTFQCDFDSFSDSLYYVFLINFLFEGFDFWTLRFMFGQRGKKPVSNFKICQSKSDAVKNFPTTRLIFSPSEVYAYRFGNEIKSREQVCKEVELWTKQTQFQTVS
jgi:hypothetical protein